MAKSWKENNTLFKESNYYDIHLTADEIEDVKDTLAQIKEVVIGPENTSESWDAFDDLIFIKDIMDNENIDIEDIEGVKNTKSPLWKIVHYCTWNNEELTVGEIYDLIDKLYEL